MKARFKCQKCDHTWEEEHKGMTQCPRCNHLYVDWLNYEEMRTRILSKGGTGYGSGNSG